MVRVLRYRNIEGLFKPVGVTLNNLTTQQ